MEPVESALCAGLGWGWGAGSGANYIHVKPEFEADHPVKPAWRYHLDKVLSKIPIRLPGPPEKDSKP